MSPSQMIAVWSPRFSRCRSRQLYETLSSPSSNHLIEILGYSKLVFLILVGNLNQSRRFACSAQNPSGSEIERAYISSYCALVVSVRAFAAALGWNTWLSLIVSSQWSFIVV